MPKLQFILDKKTDACNRYDSANGSNYGVDWSKNIPSTILEKIQGKTKEETISILEPILDKRYEINRLEDVVNELNKWRALYGADTSGGVFREVWY